MRPVPCHRPREWSRCDGDVPVRPAASPRAERDAEAGASERPGFAGLRLPNRDEGLKYRRIRKKRPTRSIVLCWSGPERRPCLIALQRSKRRSAPKRRKPNLPNFGNETRVEPVECPTYRPASPSGCQRTDFCTHRLIREPYDGRRGAVLRSVLLRLSACLMVGQMLAAGNAASWSRPPGGWETVMTTGIRVGMLLFIGVAVHILARRRPPDTRVQ